MARPSPTTPFQEELYASLGPVADQDAPLGWPLLKYCGAVAAMFDQIETYARDSSDGRPGWSILLDADRAPGSDELAWLGNFIGVDLNRALSLADQRAQIKGESAFKRGTPAAMIAAAQQYLTGNKTVFCLERDSSVDATLGGAYGLTVITYVSETPNSAAVLAALISQKPAGIILNYITVAGGAYVLLRTNYATYTAVRTAFNTYTGVRNNVPGT